MSSAGSDDRGELHSGRESRNPTSVATTSAAIGNVTFSRIMARPKTSPLSSLRGSNQPRPSWVTMMMLPPCRYLTARRVPSLKSSSYPALSSRASQLTLARSASKSFRSIFFFGRVAAVLSFSRNARETSFPPRRAEGARAQRATDKSCSKRCGGASLAADKSPAAGTGGSQ